MNTLKPQKFLIQEASHTGWKEGAFKGNVFFPLEWMDVHFQICVSCSLIGSFLCILNRKKSECNLKLVQIKLGHLCKAACALTRSFPHHSYLGAVPSVSCKLGQYCIPYAKQILHEAQPDENLRMYQKLQQIIYFQYSRLSKSIASLHAWC